MSPFITTVVDVNIDTQDEMYINVYKTCRNVNRHYDLSSHSNFMPFKYLLFSQYERVTGEVDYSPYPKVQLKSIPSAIARFIFI